MYTIILFEEFIYELPISLWSVGGQMFTYKFISTYTFDDLFVLIHLVIAFNIDLSSLVHVIAITLVRIFEVLLSHLETASCRGRGHSFISLLLLNIHEECIMCL